MVHEGEKGHAQSGQGELHMKKDNHHLVSIHHSK